MYIYSCLYDACSRATGMSKGELKEAVIMSMDRSPSSYAGLIMARNYLASTEMGKNYVMSGGYVNPMTSYANHMMVGQYIDQRYEKAWSGATLSKEDLKRAKSLAKEYGEKGIEFVKRLDGDDICLLISALPQAKLVKLLVKIPGAQFLISKGSNAFTKIFPSLANQNKIFGTKPNVKADLVTKVTNRKELLGSKTPSNVNAQHALKEKFKDLQTAQSRAIKVRELPDGRIRYYSKEVPASSFGKTRGAAYVTEYNPKNGSVKSWYENFGHDSKVVRINVKKIDGKEVIGQHYPKTEKEISGVISYKDYNKLKLEELINAIRKK
jgi:hypothetical protein